MCKQIDIEAVQNFVDELEVDFLESSKEESQEKITIFQSKHLYHFTSDSILLAKFAAAKRGDRVADFCAGCGVVGFQFLLENRQIATLSIFELQKELANLAKKTIEYNRLQNVEVIQMPLQEYIQKDASEAFDIILCNPPYERAGFAKEEYHKAICRKEITIKLEEIVQIASKKLKFGGKFVLCHKVERLAEIMYTLHKYQIEPKRLQFIQGKKIGEPYLFLLEGRKGGNIALTLLPNIVNQA